jgi:hypothetical protein
MKNFLIIAIAALAVCSSCEKKEDPKADPKSAACDITAFTVNGTAWNINGTSITYTYPAGTPATALTPAITVSRGATVSPASGKAQDFFSGTGITYTVTAEDGKTKKTYTAKAAITLSTACDITSFTVDGAAWRISGASITYTYPPETDETLPLTPVITLSRGATVTPASGTAQDFFSGAGVTYTVTAEDGATKKTYVAKATRTLSTACDVTAFTVDGVAWHINGASITYTYPPETDETLPLTPVITLSRGATVTPASGTAQDFFSGAGVTYTVTAEDGKTKKNYTAKATRTPRSACDITAFTVNGTAWSINGTSITYTYPPETNETLPLTPAITLSPGASVTPASGAAQNFFNGTGITYTVTAEDGKTKKTYVAKATRTPRTACDITAFKVNGTAWSINGTNITYTYPAGTPEGLLTPAITLSPGASITPASGVAQNFFNGAGITYTVTAEDGKTKKTYVAKATRTPRSACDITAFTVNGTAWSINGTNITYTYPAGTTPTTLTPAITLSPGASVTPASGAAQNFFNGSGVTYTVTAEDGQTKKTYVAKATVELHSSCNITAFTVNGTAWSINGTNITYTYPAGTTPTTLTPAITLSPGATVTPASGVAQNFFNGSGVTYTVTAENGVTKKTYVAKATVARSAACDITAFTVDSQPWNISGTNITYTYPVGTPVTALTPVITVSPGASVTPASGVAQNFFNGSGVTYVVTAEDGVTKKTYIAKATRTLSAACEITAFTVDGQDWDISGTNITYTYPVGTPVTALTPVITVSPGATITPASGAAQNFFSAQGVAYVVTAEDGVTKKTYTAKATRTLNTACAITAFLVNGQPWNISGTNITYIYPVGTPATTLTPVITVSPGATVTPASGVAQNFFSAQGITYVVTAEDGVTKQTYTAKATRTPNTACDITAFTVNGTDWNIDGTNITYLFPGGTQATPLTPVITVSSGATVTPASGVAQNFFGSAGVTYTVTAEDGVTKKTYTVKASITLRSDCLITAFKVNGQSWNINGADITYTYPVGAPVTALTPTITVSAGATVTPASGVAQYFFTEQGVTYLVTAEDGVTKRTYTAKATAQAVTSGLTGDCVWTITGAPPEYTLTISGSGAMGNYTSGNNVPWYDYRSNIKSFVVQEGVTNVGNYALEGSVKLTAISLGAAVTTIGERAFSGCTGLAMPVIPQAVTAIGDYAFYGCSGLTGALTLPQAVRTIGRYAFANCSKITAAALGEEVTTLGEAAFSGCAALTGVTLPQSLTALGEQAFYNCASLTGVAIPDKITVIGRQTFYGNSKLASVTLGEAVITIGEQAFYNCAALTGVIIPDKVTTIGTQAFVGCSKLASVTLGAAVITVGEQAFYNCAALTGTLTFPHAVTTIDREAFRGCTGLTGLSFGNAVRTIGEGAFRGCTGLTDALYFPHSATTIGDYAFYQCTKLTAVTIGTAVTSIGNYAFAEAGTTSVLIPSSVNTIGDYAFKKCSRLEDVNISATRIGKGAFEYCIVLDTITMNEGVVYVGESAFRSCPGVVTISLPESLSLWGLGAFCMICDAGNTPISAHAHVHVYGNTANKINEYLGTCSLASSGISVGEKRTLHIHGVDDCPKAWCSHFNGCVSY